MENPAVQCRSTKKIADFGSGTGSIHRREQESGENRREPLRQLCVLMFSAVSDRHLIKNFKGNRYPDFRMEGLTRIIHYKVELTRECTNPRNPLIRVSEPAPSFKDV